MAPFTQTARWTPRALPDQHGHFRRRLLVVDDHNPGGEAVTALLRSRGYDVRFVAGGREVPSAISAWIPDIALLDINMPDMDGFAVARQLRRRVQTRHIIIVAFTAQDESAIRARGIAVGFDGYCQKGATSDSLLRLLEEIAS